MTLKENLNEIVFGTETKAGKRFDVILLWIILFSILVVMLESVPSLGLRYSALFEWLEWMLTLVFSLEYILRIWISKKPLKYMTSFWGLVDLLSIVPTYLSFFLVGYHYLIVVRIFRLLRIFRILKLVRFNQEAKVLIDALKNSAYKISIFMVAVLAIVTFLGTLMYVIESGEQGFSSIPQSIYWAIVTVTTVGFGDIVPHTVLGKILSSVAMIIGYAIIAVPTGIVTVGIANANDKKNTCENCGSKMKIDDNFCAFCGTKNHIPPAASN